MTCAIDSCLTWRCSTSCFVSYAWGVDTDEQWVEKCLARDLKNAGIDVILDRWENSEIGSNIARFVSRIESCDWVVVVGTPMYLEKYENKNPKRGTVVATEVDLINQRYLGDEKQKKTRMANSTGISRFSERYWLFRCANREQT